MTAQCTCSPSHRHPHGQISAPISEEGLLTERTTDVAHCLLEAEPLITAVPLMNRTYSAEQEQKENRNTSYLIKRKSTDCLRDSPYPNGSRLCYSVGALHDIFRETVGNIVNVQMEDRLCILPLTQVSTAHISTLLLLCSLLREHGVIN